MSAIIKQFVAESNRNPLLAVSGKVLRMAKARIARALAAARLKELRGDLSQDAVGKRAGVSQRAVAYLLDPHGPSPTLETVESIAHAFGLEVWELLKPEANSSGNKPLEIYVDTEPPGKHGRLVVPLASKEQEALEFLRRSEPAFQKIADAFLEAFRAIDGGKHGSSSKPARANKPRRRKSAARASS